MKDEQQEDEKEGVEGQKEEEDDVRMRRSRSSRSRRMLWLRLWRRRNGNMNLCGDTPQQQTVPLSFHFLLTLDCKRRNRICPLPAETHKHALMHTPTPTRYNIRPPLS